MFRYLSPLTSPSDEDLDLDADPPVVSIRRQLVRGSRGQGLLLVEPKTVRSRRSIVLPLAMVP